MSDVDARALLLAEISSIQKERQELSIRMQALNDSEGRLQRVLSSLPEPIPKPEPPQTLGTWLDAVGTKRVPKHLESDANSTNITNIIKATIRELEIFRTGNLVEAVRRKDPAVNVKTVRSVLSLCKKKGFVYGSEDGVYMYPGPAVAVQGLGLASEDGQPQELLFSTRNTEE